jgi:hypothetical protein
LRRLRFIYHLLLLIKLVQNILKKNWQETFWKIMWKIN